MRIIGITGGTGCGKTTALDCLARRGACLIDCDALYHSMLREDRQLLDAIDRAFPGCVQKGVLDRKKLGAQVFGDPAALARLSAITDPAVDARVRALLEREAARGRRLAAVDAIRLIESGLGALCDVTVAVTAPEAQRVARLQAREGISEAYALARIRAQRSNEDFARDCDFVLDNSGELAAFTQKCERLFDSICKE